MGSVALTDKPVIWPMQEGQVLAGLRDDNHHRTFGFLSAHAIRTMVQHGWLRREGPYLHVTDVGQQTARRDFVGDFKPPRPKASTVVLTSAAPITVPGATFLHYHPGESIH
jgi:hypothetical protein